MYRNPSMPPLQMQEAVAHTSARAGFGTPEPVYGHQPEASSPQRLSGAEHMRALTAMHHARTRYPGAVGQVLVKEIEAYKELGYLAAGTAPVVRLIAELMAPPTP